jgi:hypothetical protein
MMENENSSALQEPMPLMAFWIHQSGPIRPSAARSFSRASRTGWCLLWTVLISARCQGQETVRISLAGEQAALAQHSSAASNYYNVLLGPVYLRFQGEMGMELNDNANYSHTAPDADVGLIPTLNIKALWPVTRQNSLTLSTGLGYEEYLRDSALSHVNIASDSSLNFKVYTGDFVLDLHERFSAVDYASQDPSVSANMERLENNPGLGADWDLNKMILSLGLDYDAYTSLNSALSYSDCASEWLHSRAAFLLNATDRLGLEAGGGFTTYDQNLLDNSAQFSVGPFYQGKLTPYLGAEAGLGFAAYDFAHNGAVTHVSDFDGWYAGVTFSHRLNQWLTQKLSLGREIQLGVTADLSEDYYIRYGAIWKMSPNASCAFGLTFDHGSTSGALAQTETYNSYGPNLGLSWRFSPKIVGSLTYAFVEKDSDVAQLGYAQNKLLLDFTYDF